MQDYLFPCYNGIAWNPQFEILKGVGGMGSGDPLLGDFLPLFIWLRGASEISGWFGNFGEKTVFSVCSFFQDLGGGGNLDPS